MKIIARRRIVARAHRASGTVLDVLCILAHLTFPTILYSRYYNNLYFTVRKLDYREVKVK